MESPVTITELVDVVVPVVPPVVPEVPLEVPEGVALYAELVGQIHHGRVLSGGVKSRLGAEAPS